MLSHSQYSVVPGRDASLSDVLTNTAGAALGAMLAPHVPMLLRPSRPAAARLGLAAVLLWASAWVFGAWAIGSDPGRGNWHGRVMNDLPDSPPFNGELVEASIDGAPLKVVPAPLPPLVERAFARDSFVLEGAVRPLPAIARRENVVTIIDSRPDRKANFNNDLVLVFTRASSDGIIGFRVNAARLRLRTPQFTFGTVFDAGKPVYFHFSRVRGMVRGTTSGIGAERVTEYRLGPELLWSVLGPRNPGLGVSWSFEAFLWAAGLLAVAGYWGSRSARRPALMASVVLVVAVQWLTPCGIPSRAPIATWLGDAPRWAVHWRAGRASDAVPSPLAPHSSPVALGAGGANAKRAASLRMRPFQRA